MSKLLWRLFLHLFAFEAGQDAAYILQQLPSYSSEVENLSAVDTCAELKRLVHAYETDPIGCDEAVNLQYQVWRSTFLPLAVLMEAWSRATGIVAIFYLDAFKALLLGLLNKDIAVDVAGFVCRTRYWSVGTAQPGSGKSPAVESVMRCLSKVLMTHCDLAPGHGWDQLRLMDQKIFFGKLRTWRSTACRIRASSLMRVSVLGSLEKNDVQASQTMSPPPRMIFKSLGRWGPPRPPFFS